MGQQNRAEAGHNGGWWGVTEPIRAGPSIRPTGCPRQPIYEGSPPLSAHLPPLFLLCLPHWIRKRRRRQNRSKEKEEHWARLSEEQKLAYHQVSNICRPQERSSVDQDVLVQSCLSTTNYILLFYLASMDYIIANAHLPTNYI